MYLAAAVREIHVDDVFHRERRVDALQVAALSGVVHGAVPILEFLRLRRLYRSLQETRKNLSLPNGQHTMQLAALSADLAAKRAGSAQLRVLKAMSGADATARSKSNRWRLLETRDSTDAARQRGRAASVQMPAKPVVAV